MTKKVEREVIRDWKTDDRVEEVTVSDDRNTTNHNSTRRSRSVAPDRRSTSKTFQRSDSRDHTNRNYRSNTTNNDLKNDNKGQKQGNPSQNFSSSIRRNNDDSRDRTYNNDRTASNNSNGHDFSSRNNYNQRRFSYFFILAKSSIHSSLFTITSNSEEEIIEKHMISLIILIYNMKREYQNIFFDFTKFTNGRDQVNPSEYDIIYNIFQKPTQNNNITCYMMTGQITTQSKSKEDITNTTSKETTICVSGSVPPTEHKMVDVYDSNTPSIITSGAQEEVHMFGVSHKRKLMSQDDLKNMRNQALDKKALKIIAGSTHNIKNEGNIPTSDAIVNHEFHPVYSTILLSGHGASTPDRLEFGKNFQTDYLGYSPVQVISSCVKWPTNNDKYSTEFTSENFSTEIEYLAEMCDTGELTPMDVMGIALSAENELVKHERTFDDVNQWNVFDCEIDKTDELHSSVNSMLTTVGFTSTEILPHGILPLPDHDSPAMTLAKRYGGVIPSLPNVDPKADKLSVKVTRWITKKHVHVFPMINVYPKSVIPRTSSSATTNYDEECMETTAEIVRDYIDKLERPEVSTETDEPVMIDFSSQCCPSDLANTNPEPTHPELVDYESFCSDMFKNMIAFYSQWKKLQKDSSTCNEEFHLIQDIATKIFPTTDQTTDITTKRNSTISKDPVNDQERTGNHITNMRTTIHVQEVKLQIHCSTEVSKEIETLIETCQPSNSVEPLSKTSVSTDPVAFSNVITLK